MYRPIACYFFTRKCRMKLQQTFSKIKTNIYIIQDVQAVPNRFDKFFITLSESLGLGWKRLSWVWKKCYILASLGHKIIYIVTFAIIQLYINKNLYQSLLNINSFTWIADTFYIITPIPLFTTWIFTCNCRSRPKYRSVVNLFLYPIWKF